MTSIISVSATELRGRRQTLRRRRRRQILHGVCRNVAVASLAGGLCWGATQPVWIISEPAQITIEGNKLLSDQAIRSLVSLTYPQSLLRIEPQAIVQKLESPQSAIAKATVTRQLFPPGLTVQVQERQPVATVIGGRNASAPNGDRASAPPLPSVKTDPRITQPSPVGLLDENGALIPLESYTALKASIPLPTLKIIGFQKQYLSYWSEVYQVVRDSPVKVFEINWQDSENLILKTELGVVHLGRYSAQLAQQLAVLDSLRQLPAQLKSSPIAYIDLRNPESPAIQMQATTPPTNPKPSQKSPHVRKPGT